MSIQSICAILNPTAGNGQAGRERNNIEVALSNHFEQVVIWETQGPNHASELAEQAGLQGFEMVVAIGGDGSVHEVVNGLMRLPLDERPILGVIPFGTGGDFRRSIHVPKNVQRAVYILAHGQKRTIDVGTAKVTTSNGEISEKFFINVAGFGANGEVVDKSNRWSKRFGGRVTFLNATLHTTFTYHAPKVQIQWTFNDEAESWTGEMLSCFIANASYCGGGMQVAPESALGDGQLHFRLLPKLSVASQLMHLPKLYNDEIHKVEGAVTAPVMTIKAAANRNQKVQIDLDGELSGVLPAEFGLIAQALNVQGGWQAH